MNEKITINDIARLAGVSKTTVSFYLNGKFERMSEVTRRRIAQAIEKTGYQPSAMARSLNLNRTHLIGVIIGDITNFFAAQIVKGAEACCRQKGYQMIVSSSGYELENERRCVRGMTAMGVDGFIVQPTIHFETMWAKQGEEKPIVYFDSPNRLDEGMWVKTNNYEAVYEAMEQMIQRGYRRFVMITADPYARNTRLERSRGFTDCLEASGLPYEVLLADAQSTPALLTERLKPFLDRREPTCIFACSNWLLDKTYLALRPYCSWMPQDLGLIGFDSLAWTELVVPTVTTIVQPAYEEGETAARILIAAVENPSEYTSGCILKCTLHEQDSTRRSL